MWKKTDAESNEVPVPAAREFERQPMREKAIIGPSLVLKGDLTGEEDLTIQGRVEGKVVLKKNGITVGRDGRVKADLYAKSITVEGDVRGNLYADERIVIRETGHVKGNLVAPRVKLDEGSKFKGSIDMDSAQKQTASPEPPSPKISTPPGKSTPTGESAKGADQPKLGIKMDQPSSKT